ncbi:unnamed protein product [Pneumocystis jirovecii]|uniref:Metal homeostatis protein BSD2 n=2 Tax=Pneumocystis jirovecii TaxID=42068 RepID=L0P916_PNEJI|nr:uncharacterized protein T551_01591 [Pneumocystis jirovecii RU7]KTW31039.1 hypothetical protein T551_01591 [Pneumocystis jirovecii RU7]CCJ28584.1 unnamed protein product [Pneumocystis jirovecii]
METFNKNQNNECNEEVETIYEIEEDPLSPDLPYTSRENYGDSSASASTHLLHENIQKDEFTPFQQQKNEKKHEQLEKNKNKASKSFIRSFTSRISSHYTSTFHQNDGVFANLNAKPEVSKEKFEEFPPSYEQAAADATPSYWENTMIAPGISEDEVFINGLPVGNIFGFLWNMLISFSFQFIGFLLTYLLHTTYAAKCGSKAGLGTTLIQYGFYMRSIKDNVFNDDTSDNNPKNDNQEYQNDSLDHIIISYLLMIIGWFLLFRSTTEFLKARRIEMCVRETSSPSNTTQTTRNEASETAV